jgi:hypothetical protein
VTLPLATQTLMRSLRPQHAECVAAKAKVKAIVIAGTAEEAPCVTASGTANARTAEEEASCLAARKKTKARTALQA